MNYTTKFLIAGLIFLAAMLNSCTDYDVILNYLDKNIVQDTLNITIGTGGNEDNYSNSPDGQIVSFANGNLQLTGRLYIPEGDGPFPAVVVMHGCTGLWSDFENGEMKNQFEEWAQILRTQESMIVLFVDSYQPRSIDEFCDIEPPNDFICSPIFVRNTDAYAALDFLRNINKVIDNKIGILGFSHGGTAVLNSVVDADYVKKANETDWRLYKSGFGWLTYNDGVRAPMQEPAAGGFACAVSYYPGAAMYSYYGSISNPNSGKYKSYAPILLNAAQLDPLYDNDINDNIDGKTTVFYKRAIKHGTDIEMIVYNNATHTFDAKDSGDDAIAKTDARINTINFLNTYLK